MATHPNKISLFMATYHPARVDRANALIKMIKENSGCEVEMIVVTDNPETYDSYIGADQVIKLPKRIGFTKAINIGEKFAHNGVGWWIDDYVIPEKGWGPKALKGFYDRFPDGMGIMEISGKVDDCPKSISTRKFMYEVNGGDWLWGEYIHDGDTETWNKVVKMDKFYVYPEILWHRDKIFDECKKQSDSEYDFDIPLRQLRESNNWRNDHDPQLRKKMYVWAFNSGNPRFIELYKNIYNDEFDYGY